MEVLVDANIIFSAILNSEGKIGDLLLNSKGSIFFFAPKYLLTEISKYYHKIEKLTDWDIDKIISIQNRVTREIEFIPESDVPEKWWAEAEHLLTDIDPKDTPYLAFASHLNIKIWSGDKSLRVGLAKKGVNAVITTNELFKKREMGK